MDRPYTNKIYNLFKKNSVMSSVSFYIGAVFYIILEDLSQVISVITIPLQECKNLDRIEEDQIRDTCHGRSLAGWDSFRLHPSRFHHTKNCRLTDTDRIAEEPCTSQLPAVCKASE